MNTPSVALGNVRYATMRAAATVALRELVRQGHAQPRPVQAAPALAAAVGEKKLKMATQAEAERLTGLQVGGISALALLNKGFEVYLSDSARDLPALHVSAGDRRANLRLAVADFVALTGARWVAV